MHLSFVSGPGRSRRLRQARSLWRSGARTAGFSFVVAILSSTVACSDDATAPADRASSSTLRRLLVADASEAKARFVDLGNRQNVQTFSLAGGVASLVYSTHSGRYVVVHQRDANMVQLFDGGVWHNGSTVSRGTPNWLPHRLDGAQPTHENIAGPWISIFSDGTGTARWIDERELLSGNFRVAMEIESGGPHHSGSATLHASTGTSFVYAPLNPAGGLPTSVVVVNAQKQELLRNDNCPSMHGNGSNKQAVLFGCVDGAVIVRQGAGGTPTIAKLTPSGTLAGLGVRTVWGEYDAPFLVGRLSSPTGVTPARRVLATIDPVSGGMSPLPLAEGLRDHAVTIDPYTKRIVVLTTDGALHIFDGATRTLQRSVAGVAPAMEGTVLAHTIAIAEGMAYVTSPSRGEVVEVDTDTGRVVSRISVGGQPSRIALMGVRARGTFPISPL